MAEPRYEFHASYDDAMIEHAAKTFMRYLYKTYGPLLIGACIVNIVGFILVLALSGGGALTAVIGVIAVLGPIYFTWAYRRFPQKFAMNMKKGLKPLVHVSITSSSLSMSANERSFTKPLADFKTILEFPDYFMFVLGPFAFTFVPKKHTPDAAQQLIRKVGSPNAVAAKQPVVVRRVRLAATLRAPRGKTGTLERTICRPRHFWL